MASVYVKISSPVTAVQMYCPPTGVSSVQVPCNATIWGGTNMHVTASYDDGNSDIYPLAGMILISSSYYYYYYYYYYY
jgi:hypothetical protein